MTNKEFEKKMNAIQEKLGKEASGLIADEIGLLITDNSKVNNEIEEKNKEIEKLKQDKENLITVNGNLLQQVAMGEEPKKDEEETEVKKQAFDFRSVFDANGNFKK